MKKNKTEHIDENILLQYLLGNLKGLERAEVEEWLKQSAENRKSLEKLEALWLETGKISPAPVAVDTDAAWKKLSGLIREEERKAEMKSSKGKTRMMRLTIYTSGIAATLLILFGLYFFLTRDDESGKMILVDAQYRITADTLSDGSVIVLNKHSRLSRPEKFGSGKREVTLSGEASCMISSDPDRPFFIDCGKAKIRVLGTKFHVRAYPEQAVTVIVKEGLVLLFTTDSITGDTNGTRLGAGMKGILRQGSLIPEKMNGSTGGELQDIEENLNYKETPLQTVFADLARIYGTEIRVSDTLINHCRLTASFTGQTPDQVLRVISATFGLDLKKIDETYLLTGNGCMDKAK